MNSLEHLYQTQKDHLPGDTVALLESEDYKISELECWTYSNNRRNWSRLCFCYYKDRYMCLIFCDDKGKYQALGVELLKKANLPSMLGTISQFNCFRYTLDFTSLLRSVKAKDQKKLVSFISKSGIDKKWFRGIASSYGVDLVV